jgi:RNA-directed DNA polymerase
MKPILSLRDFARRIATPIGRLKHIAEEIESHYHQFSVKDEKTQKVRQFRNPSPELKEIHRRINRVILSIVEISTIAHGGVAGKSTRSNAGQHLGQPCLINVDVKQFFPNVRHYMVYRLFRGELGFGRDVARFLTRLTTLHSELPQGAPTSTTIANLLLSSAVDVPVAFESSACQAKTTRFVDDFTFSGNDPRSLINFTAKALSRRRLPIWRKNSKFQPKAKLKITPLSRRQEVTGLVVNSRQGPSVSRERRDAVRAAIYQLKNISDVTARLKAINTIRGKIAYVRRFNPGSAARFQKYLDSRSGTTAG